MYKLTNMPNVIRFDAGSFVDDGKNLYSRTYRDWLAAGNTPDPADPEPVPVRYVSKYVILQRVAAAGKFAEAMAALGGPGELAYEMWSAAQEIDSSDAQVRALLTSIGLNPDEVLA